MLHRRHMPMYLVALWVLLDIVLFIGAARSRDWRDDLFAGLFLLLGGQFVAITGWIVLSRTGIRSSLLGLLVGQLIFVMTDHLLGIGFGPVVTAVSTMFISSMYALFVNFPLLLALSSGWRFVYDPPPTASANSRYQFSLREIMAYMLLVALGGALWAATEPGSAGPLSEPGLAAFVLAFPTPWCIWAAFWYLRPIHAPLVAMSVSGLWSIVLVRLLDNSHQAIWVGLIPAAVLVTHLSALHAAGFRLRLGEVRTDSLVDESVAPSDPDSQANTNVAQA